MTDDAFVPAGKSGADRALARAPKLVSAMEAAPTSMIPQVTLALRKIPRLDHPSPAFEFDEVGGRNLFGPQLSCLFVPCLNAGPVGHVLSNHGPVLSEHLSIGNDIFLLPPLEQFAIGIVERSEGEKFC